MLHELKDIIANAIVNQKKGLKNVMATVVHLEGSSYRKPGVRMLISEDMKMTGAVSGGCVEAEVRRRAKSVFKDGKPKMMTYDGRHRLGCEGMLYILIEPFIISEEFLETFQNVLELRQEFVMESYYQLEDQATGNFGSSIHFKDGSVFNFNKTSDTDELQMFSQILKPNLKLLIIGAEHDAVKLCHIASILGWEVDVITSVKDPKQISDFPGAKSVTGNTPELIDLNIDNETVVVLMTHNYARDLKYLLKLTDCQLKYLGVLGSRKRRDQLQNDLLNYKEDLTEEFLETIYSPAGLNIGAITPEEIALSILSEILSVTRQAKSVSLRTIIGKTHA